MASSIEYHVVGAVEWDSVLEVTAFLRKHGLHPEGDDQPDETAELTRHWTWRIRASRSLRPISVPNSEVELATKLMNEWRRDRQRDLGRITARVRRDVAIATIGFIVIAALMSLWLQDIQQGISNAVLLTFLILLLTASIKLLRS